MSDEETITLFLSQEEINAVGSVLGRCLRRGFDGTNHRIYEALDEHRTNRNMPEEFAAIPEETPSV